MKQQAINNMTIYDDNGEPIEQKLDVNIIPSQHEIILNSYFKNSRLRHKHNYFTSIEHSSFNNTVKKTSFYLTLTNEISTPNLFHFFSMHNDFLMTQFYDFLVKNFAQLKEQEISFINDYMSPKKNQDIILKNILADDNIISEQHFKDLLYQDLKKDFTSFYQQCQVTKYALDNFQHIDKQDMTQLWKIIDLPLTQKLFLKKAIKTETKIHDLSFFKNSLKINDYLSNYFHLAVEKKWSDNIIFFIKNFSTISLDYFNNYTYSNTSSAINFEKLFLYFHPDKINQSRLDEENINLVFSKINKNLPHEDLLHQDNISFYNKLGPGLFKFIEHVYHNDPEKTYTLLTDSYISLLHTFDISRHYIDFIDNNNILSLLVANLDKMNHSLQQSFNNNVLTHFMPNIFEDKPLIHNIINALPPESFLLTTVIDHAYGIDNTLENAFIHKLLNHFVNHTHDTYVLSKKIQLFSFSALENFNQHLQFSLSILKDEGNLDDITVTSVEQVFKKSLLNKTLTNNFNHVRQVKQSKI